MNSKDEIKEFLPLSAAELHIMLALVHEDLHGYGIMLEVARQSNDQYKLGPGTLYDNLERLLEHGIVEGAPQRSSAESSRRRYYRLTRFGRRVLATEITRLEGVVRQAKLHLKINPERA